MFGVNEALDAIRGDDQLARRLDEHFLPLWEDDVEFSRLIQTLISAMELKRASGLRINSLRTILNVTGGVTSRVFTMIKALAIDAIRNRRGTDHRRGSSGMAANVGQTFLERAAPPGCRFSVRLLPLPRCPPPLADELLSSWLKRLARANYCTEDRAVQISSGCARAGLPKRLRIQRG